MLLILLVIATAVSASLDEISATKELIQLYEAKIELLKH